MEHVETMEKEMNQTEQNETKLENSNKKGLLF